ncbi:MAG: hypothetical protein OEY74_06655, partial [Gammaproteobacteria bacterium]|nr:hypothetical protein [Gammaproteobacteria bacterium]
NTQLPQAFIVASLDAYPATRIQGSKNNVVQDCQLAEIAGASALGQYQPVWANPGEWLRTARSDHYGLISIVHNS